MHRNAIEGNPQVGIPNAIYLAVYFNTLTIVVIAEPAEPFSDSPF